MGDFHPAATNDSGQTMAAASTGGPYAMLIHDGRQPPANGPPMPFAMQPADENLMVGAPPMNAPQASYSAIGPPYDGAQQQQQSHAHPSLPVTATPIAALPGAPLRDHYGLDHAPIKVHPAVRMFETWHRTSPLYRGTFQPLSHLPVSTLLLIIGDWIDSMKKTHGGSYSADTLYVYVSSIQRHIRVAQNAPQFNLLDSEPVKRAMEAKFGREAMSTVLNRGLASKKRKAQAEHRAEAAQFHAAPAAAAAVAVYKTAKADIRANPQLFGLPSGEVLAFKPPKPSHCHRSFHTESRLLLAPQDPSTPEGLLRCLLWIMLTHMPSMSRTACWNLTTCQFQVLSMPSGDSARPDGTPAQPLHLRYLLFTPTKKRDQQPQPGTAAALVASFGVDSQQVIMYEQPTLPHCCPVFLYTEYLRHRPGKNLLTRDTKAEQDGEGEYTPLWLLTKKSIDDHSSQWYANRRIGQATMEKLISVVKNSRNAPTPIGGDPLGERANRMAQEEEHGSDGEGEEAGGGGGRLSPDSGAAGHQENGPATKKSRHHSHSHGKSAAASPQQLQQSSLSYHSHFPGSAAVAASHTPVTTLFPNWPPNLQDLQRQGSNGPTAGANGYPFFGAFHSGAAAAAAAAAAVPLPLPAASSLTTPVIPQNLSPAEMQSYIQSLEDQARQMKSSVLVIERAISDLKAQQAARATADEEAAAEAAAAAAADGEGAMQL